MITFEFQDLKELKRRLTNQRERDIDKIAKILGEGNEWKQTLKSTNPPQPWYVHCGSISLIEPLESVDIHFNSNGEFYWGNAKLEPKPGERIRLPDIDNSIGDEDTKTIVLDRESMFSIAKSSSSSGLLYLSFGDAGTKRRPVKASDDEFERDLRTFTGLIGKVVNAQYPEGNAPNINYYLNPS
ncbi:MAG: hypothetical protein AABW89_00915 [Nanoarchaeota archaeon]